MHIHGDDGSGHSRHGRGLKMAAILTAGGGAASLILYLHGSSLWVAPAAGVGIILAHLVVFGGIAFLVTRFVGGRSHAGGGHGHGGGGLLLHNPGKYDCLVGLLTLGREGRLRRWMVDLAGLKEGDAVLDVGCGTGTLLMAAAEHVGQSGTLRGVEPSSEMCAGARLKASERGIPIEVAEAWADALPHPDASFDAVFCTLVLHHLPKDVRETAIREMRRVLRPGGRLVLVDWQKPRSIWGAMTSGLLLIHILHSFGSGVMPLDSPELESLLKQLGFGSIDRSAFSGSVMGATVGRLAL